MQKRGKIDISKIPRAGGAYKWSRSIDWDEVFYYDVSYTSPYSMSIHDLDHANPPIYEYDVEFFESRVEVVRLDKSWVLAAIDKLPFEGIRKTVTFKSVPDNAGVTCKSI